jgi:hypothetical protein
MTNWDSALDLKRAPKTKKTKQEETETEKAHKHSRRKNFLITSDL